ncbi:fibronectin type III domain-containing protein [Acidisarcina polymorpha]|nr:fibronectin type III domain-containing protein [Acidisarcina polymorpha]
MYLGRMYAGRHRLVKGFTLAIIVSSCLLLPQRFLGGNVLAVESFNGSAGPLQNTNGGLGWASPWQVQNGSIDVPGYGIATMIPLSYAGISTSGYATGGDAWQYAGRLLDTSPGGSFSPYLSGQMIGAPSTTLLVGLLMRKDIDTDEEMSVTLHAGNPPWWISAPGTAIGHFGSSSNTGGVRYWSLRLDGIVHQTGIPVVVGQPAFLVLQISFGPSSTVNLYVNPPAGSLPATPDAQAVTTNSIAFQSVAFYGGSGSGQSSIGDLRFASAYSSIVDSALPVPPAPATVSALSGNGSVSLSWSSVSGANEYLVYQLVNGMTQLAATVSAGNYVDTGLTNGTAYTFYVIASNSAGAGPPSPQVTGVPHGAPPPPHPGLGTNLTQVADYNREWPFVDAFKTARPWIPQQQGASWGQGAPLELNSKGWITSLQPGQYAETIMFDNAQDDQANYPAGQYTLLYDGSGTLSFDLQSGTIVSQTPGRMVVNVPTGLNGIFLIESATDPSNPIRNIRFILPGFEKTYRTRPFHPLFLQKLQSYQVLRFMEWMTTNGSTVQNWSDRATPADYTYSWRGVPLEVMIELANTLNAKPWFNIPAQASDAYVTAFANLVQQRLKPNLTFYLEYSNETWNRSFSQSAYIEAQGLALGFSNDPTLNGADYTAYRSVQIFNLFKPVVGPGRMTRVIASQAGNSWLSAQTLQFQNAFASADVLAIAPYFNCDDSAIGGSGVLGDPSTEDQVASMSIDQVDDIQLAHINNCALQQMQSNAAVAASYGLAMVGYEGGQSLVGYNGAENNTTMTALFKAVNRGDRMQSLYAQYLQNWVDAGGDLFVHYSDMGAYAKFGNFGTLEFQDQDPATSPKYTALMNFAQQHPR